MRRKLLSDSAAAGVHQKINNLYPGLTNWQLYTSWERSTDRNVLDIDCWFFYELQRLRYRSTTSSLCVYYTVFCVVHFCLSPRCPQRMLCWSPGAGDGRWWLTPRTRWAHTVACVTGITYIRTWAPQRTLSQYWVSCPPVMGRHMYSTCTGTYIHLIAWNKQVLLWPGLLDSVVLTVYWNSIQWSSMFAYSLMSV